VNVPTDLGLLSSIGICTGAAALIAAVTWRFKQPLIIAYLATGVIIGPIGLKFVTDQGSISTVAEIGLILLLFVIGLEIDIRKMASGGAAVLLTGALQVPICIALGLAFFWVLGVRNAPGNSALLYLALKRANVPAELHIYQKGGHGFGVRKSSLACSSWTERCIAWLKDQGFLGTNAPAR